MLRSKLYSRSVIVLGAIQLIESIAFALPMSYFPNYVISLGASVASLGLFISSFMVSSAIMSPRMGALSDKHGRKRMMIFGLIGDIIFGTLTGLVPSWHWLMLVRILDGTVSSAAMLSAEALLIDTVPSTQRGEASGFVMAMGMVGRNIGPVFGGFIQWYALSVGLSLLNSYRIPYFVDSVLALMALILVLVLIQEPKVEGIQREMRLEAARNASKVPLSTSFKILLIYSFINGLGVGFIMPISVLFYNDKFGIDPIQIGTIISISGFIGLFASWLAGRVSDRAGRMPIIVSGNVVSRLCGFVLPLTADVTQAAGVMSVRSLGFSVSMPALRALRADITPPEARGKYFGMFMTAWTAGDVIGPIMGSFLYDLYRFSNFDVGGFTLPGYGIPFFLNAILGLAATFFLLAFVREPRMHEADPVLTE
jgi:MFS family permease